jgi:hypothetical protein
MRAPFPVEITSTLGRFWRGALGLLVAGSVAVPLAWGLPHVAAQSGSRLPDPLLAQLARPIVQVGLAAWVAAMTFAAFWLCSQDIGAEERRLRWDGEDWILPGARPGDPEQRGRASLMLDLGPWMLVRFLPYAGAGPGHGTWLPLHLTGDLARWTSLRSALWTWRGRPG